MRSRDRSAKERIVRMLDIGKEDLNEESRRAAIADFTHVAEEYFETESPVTLQTVTEKRGMEVVVRFRVRRVKNFTTLKS